MLAIEQDAKVDILHACGGNARCTTCRVEFIEGEPDRMTVAEKEVLERKGATGVRLSCQIVCDHDIAIAEVAMTKGNQGWTDTGPAPEPTVTPEAVFYPKEELGA